MAPDVKGTAGRTVGRRGFALPAVLAVTGVVTLIFLVAITALATLTAEAASARARVQFLQRALTTEATLSYITATEPMSQQGFSIGAPRRPGGLAIELPSEPPQAAGPVSIFNLDARPYVIAGDTPVWISVQDQAGQINLAALSAAQWSRLGILAGISPTVSADLADLYGDYVDRDDLKRIDGAERAQYTGSGPANRILLRPGEVLSFAGVRQGIDLRHWRALRGDLAFDPTLRNINVNTATANTFQVLFDIDTKNAQAAVDARRNGPFISLADFVAASGAVVQDDGLQFFTFPASRMMYVIRDPSSAWVYRGRITMTPGGLEQPVWIDQTELTEAPGGARADISNATAFPYPAR